MRGTARQDMRCTKHYMNRCIIHTALIYHRIHGSDTHLHRRHSLVIDYADVTPQLQQLAYNSRVPAFGRVHESRESLLISFINATFRKAVASSNAVNDDAHIACEGSEMQVGVPVVQISSAANCNRK